MSTSANIEVIKDVYGAFGRGDVQAILDRLSDDVTWRAHLDPIVPWAGDYSGKRNVPRFFAGIYEPVEVLAFEPKEWVADGDTVVSIGEFACRARSTGKEARTRWVFLWKLADGRITSYEQFHQEGLADIFR